MEIVKRMMSKVVATLLMAVLFVPLCLVANNVPVADYVDGGNSSELVTEEAISALGALVGPERANALAHALKLNMALYDGDMRTQSGRRRWHGVLVSEEIYTNQLCKVEVYSNKVTGAVWRFRTPYRQKEPKRPKPPSLSKDGVPARLAAARAAREKQMQQKPAVTNIVRQANK